MIGKSPVDHRGHHIKQALSEETKNFLSDSTLKAFKIRKATILESLYAI